MSAGAEHLYNNKILQTVICYAVAPSGKKLKVRCLMDQGSEISLLSREVAEKLKLKGQDMTLQMSVAGGGLSESSEEKEVSFRLEALDGSFVSDPIKASTSKLPVADIRPIPVKPKRFRHLRDVDFTEKYPVNKGRKVDLLLDTASCIQLLTGKIVSSPKKSAPVAVQTKLGPVLAGHFLSSQKEEEMPPKVYSIAPIDPRDKEVLEAIKSFSQREQLSSGMENSDLSYDEVTALKKFKESLRYNAKEKKFYTKLLWRDGMEGKVGSNYEVARSIAMKQNARVKRDGKKKETDEAFQELLDKGFAEVIEDTVQSKLEGYHIPTVPVYKPDRITTKVRLCLNCSCKTKTGNSLNDCLHQGIDYLPDLQQLLIRCRMKKYVWSLDVSKMYFSIQMEKEERKYLKFMWCFGNDTQPTLMRMTCLPFGMNNSPFQASQVVRELAEKHSSSLPLAVELVHESLYIDDGLSMKDEIDVSVEQAKQMLQLFEYGGLKTQKWVSSHKKVLDLIGIPQEMRHPEENVKILGVQWNLKQDIITFDFLKQVSEVPAKITKRVILSIGSSLFDPLGLIAPATVQVKLLFQKTWREYEEKDWDKELPLQLTEPFKEWAVGIKKLKNMTLPRLVVDKTADEISLAVLADASPDAYGAVVYVLSWKAGKVTKSQLLTAKSKLAPVKFNKNDESLSIARLELLASLLAVKIAKYVKECLKKPNMQVWYFSDSKVTLDRIRSKTQTKFKPWVYNRLYYIMQNAQAKDFYHISGVLNSADFLTKSVDPELLAKSQVWLEGPAFIQLPKEKWPKETALTIKEAKELQRINLQEIKKEKDEMENLRSRKSEVAALSIAQCHVLAKNAQLKNGENEWLKWSNQFSDWNKIVNVLAWVNRFVRNVKTKWENNKISKQPIASRTRSKIKVKQMDKEQSGTPDQQNAKISIGSHFNAANDLFLTLEEKKAATLFLIKVAQGLAYKKEINVLRNGGRLEPSSPLIKLLPFIDENNVLRMKSRLTQCTNLETDTKAPILLPKHSTLIEKMILALHKLYSHTGLNTLEYMLRRRYWQVGGRQEIKRILHLCKHKHCRPTPRLTQQMSSLPPERVEATAPFTHVSMDIAGPILCYHKCDFKKCAHPASHKYYLLCLSCFYSRVISIELMSSMETQSILLAYRRFLARRGVPSFLFSDQARSFKQAKVEIQKLYSKLDQNKIKEEVARKGTVYKMSLPRAAWCNAMVERSIGLLKRSLRPALGATHFTDISVLHTAILECEAIVNSRPLAPCSSDPLDELPITPAMLVAGRPLQALPDLPEEIEVPPKFEALYKKRKAFVDKFRAAWRKHYFLHLRNTSKWHTQEHRLKENSLVLIHEPGEHASKNAPWLVGRVHKIHLSRDGLPREIELQVKHDPENPPNKPNFLTRHINSLSLFEDADGEIIPQKNLAKNSANEND